MGSRLKADSLLAPAKRTTSPTFDCRLPTASSGRGCSALPLRDGDGQPVELVADPDLAGQPRGRPDLEGEVEHVLFHRLGLADDLLVGLVDIDVAGGTSAGTAAFGLDAGDTVADGVFHHGRAVLGLDFVTLAVS